jgi:hypothetical protein
MEPIVFGTHYRFSKTRQVGDPSGAGIPAPEAVCELAARLEGEILPLKAALDIIQPAVPSGWELRSAQTETSKHNNQGIILLSDAGAGFNAEHGWNIAAYDELKCSECGKNLVACELFVHSGSVLYCPNDAVMTVAKLKNCLPALVTKSDPCALCGKPSCGRIFDFFIERGKGDLAYNVCLLHFQAVMGTCLTPAEFHMLTRQAGGITFNTHEDFYTDDGEAVQRRIERKSIIKSLPKKKAPPKEAEPKSKPVLDPWETTSSGEEPPTANP